MKSKILWLLLGVLCVRITHISYGVLKMQILHGLMPPAACLLPPASWPTAAATDNECFGQFRMRIIGGFNYDLFKMPFIVTT